VPICCITAGSGKSLADSGDSVLFGEVRTTDPGSGVLFVSCLTSG
jgi:hypothetical protein